MGCWAQEKDLFLDFDWKDGNVIVIMVFVGVFDGNDEKWGFQQICYTWGFITFGRKMKRNQTQYKYTRLEAKEKLQLDWNYSIALTYIHHKSRSDGTLKRKIIWEGREKGAAKTTRSEKSIPFAGP